MKARGDMTFTGAYILLVDRRHGRVDAADGTAADQRGDVQHLVARETAHSIGADSFADLVVAIRHYKPTVATKIFQPVKKIGGIFLLLCLWDLSVDLRQSNARYSWEVCAGRMGHIYGRDGRGAVCWSASA